MSEETNVGLGSLPTLLTVLFVGLKLGEVIAWSWLWVLSPLWIGLAIGLGLIVLGGIIEAIQ